MLSFSVCVISIIRLIVLSRLYDVDVTCKSLNSSTLQNLHQTHHIQLGNYVDAAIWSAAEPTMGVIAACIPSLRPLTALIWRGNHRGPTMVLKSSKSAQATTSSGSSRMRWPVRQDDGPEVTGGFNRFDDRFNQGRWGHDVNVHGGKQRGTTGEDEISLQELNSPSTGIRVKKEVTITSTNWEYKDLLY